jgi:hypothetical protein
VDQEEGYEDHEEEGSEDEVGEGGAGTAAEAGREGDGRKEEALGEAADVLVDDVLMEFETVHSNSASMPNLADGLDELD